MDAHRAAVVEREPPVAGEMIGMRVRLEDGREPYALPLRHVDVPFDRVRRVDDHRGPRAFVADDVGRTAESLVDELPEDHERRAYHPCLRRPV